MAKKKSNIEEDGLPAAIDIETFILGAMLTDEEAVPLVLDALRVEDLCLRKNQLIFAAIKDLARIKVGIDRMTVYNKLAMDGDIDSVDGLSYLVSLDDNFPPVYNLRDWIAIVIEKANLRRLFALGENLQKKAASGIVESKVIIGELDAQIQKQMEEPGRQLDTMMSLSTFVESFTGGINSLLDPSKADRGILTGFSRLDDRTSGFHESEVWLVGAAPRCGKTAFAMQVAQNIARESIPVGVWSLEMPRVALYRRMICAEAYIPVTRFKAGNLSEEERVRLQEANSKIMELPIYIDDSGGWNSVDLSHRVDNAIKKFGIQLVVIDFLQLMSSTNPKHSEYERMNEATLGIQGIAKRTGLPFLVLSQLSRQHLKMRQKPSLSDFRGAGSIEQIANVAVLLDREELTKKGKPELRGKAEFLLEKNRDGESDEIPMRFIGWRMRFEDIERGGLIRDNSSDSSEDGF